MVIRPSSTTSLAGLWQWCQSRRSHKPPGSTPMDADWACSWAASPSAANTNPTTSAVFIVAANLPAALPLLPSFLPPIDDRWGACSSGGQAPGARKGPKKPAQPTRAGGLDTTYAPPINSPLLSRCATPAPYSRRRRSPNSRPVAPSRWGRCAAWPRRFRRLPRWSPPPGW